ncbi:MAG TPA: GNAT family N-acetyltransferase [Trebonia sp.]|nr:GNAT family N-acetyltransferase [Trebonia sp.]
MAVADAAGDAVDADPVVTDNPAESRYELHLGGELAGSVRYHLRGQQITLIHTEVDPRFQGAGLATHLARFSLDDARKRGLAVLPFCPYVNSWIGKHPGYEDLVPPDRRAEFGLA